MKISKFIIFPGVETTPAILSQDYLNLVLEVLMALNESLESVKYVSYSKHYCFTLEIYPDIWYILAQNIQKLILYLTVYLDMQNLSINVGYLFLDYILAFH